MAYIQPSVQAPYAFVFNGFLKYAELVRPSRTIQACDMGLSDGYTYAFYNANPRGLAYYQLYQVSLARLHMVCSAPFGPWEWRFYEWL